MFAAVTFSEKLALSVIDFALVSEVVEKEQSRIGLALVPPAIASAFSFSLVGRS